MNNFKYKVGQKFETQDKRYTIKILHLNTDDYWVETQSKVCFNAKETYINDYYIEIEPTEKLEWNDDIHIQAPTKQVGGEHYSKLKIDPYEYSMVNGLNPLQMNAVKYITRYKDKNGVEDLKKAIHTINRLIDFENR